MLSAFIQDFTAIPGIEIATLLGRDVPGDLSGVVCRQISAEDEKEAFIDACRQADAALVIAPEFDNLLLERSQWILEAGARSLGCSPDGIKLTGDKLQLCRQLHSKAVPTPPCASWHESRLPFSFPLVLKPRFGAGSQATFLVQNRREMDLCYGQGLAEGWTGPMLLQPFVRGKHVSVSFLIGPEQTVPLLPVTQELTNDGRFRYLGGRMPLEEELAERAVRLGRQAVSALIGLNGYVGVDLVLGIEGDGSRDWVIEINPRPTTSYVGLRTLARENLAQALLDVVQGRPVARLLWRSKRVRFYPDGALEA
jgi:predicted ATP-grasp superfamily ATP-dependent carboligase